MATACGITNHYRGGTAQQYDNTVKVVHPDGGKRLPPGQTYHVAGPTDDGFLVIAMWDSQASWEKFRDETLLPALPKVEGGFPGPPEETFFQVHNQQSA